MTEWSGILLYTVEGSIKEPENMIITLKDIIPMDKGSTAFTGYTFTEKRRVHNQEKIDDKHMDYVFNHPEAINWKIGHIHSHHSMDVFFSTTDMAELNDNSSGHNFYLSLIVNNFMKFKAKVSFIGEVTTEVEAPYIALDENGEQYEVEMSRFSVTKNKLYLHDCIIESPSAPIEVDSLFSSSVKDIIRQSEVKAQHQNNFQQKKKNKSKKVVKKTPKLPPAPQEPTWQNSWQFPEGAASPEQYTDVELFALALLNGTNPPAKGVTMITTLEDILLFDENNDDVEILIINSVMDNFSALYDKYFGETAPNTFVSISEQVIEIYEEYEPEYAFLTKIIEVIKLMIEKFEEYATTAS